MKIVSKWKNIEKRVYRQRLVIEGKYTKPFTPAILRRFLKDLSICIRMTIIYGPIVKNLAGRINPDFGGLEAIMIWAESGAQLYVWEKYNFFTLDIYTCKKFDTMKAIEFTKERLHPAKMVWREV